jgi:hypothetical protein
MWMHMNPRPCSAGKATFTPAQQELSKVVCAYQRAVHAGTAHDIIEEVKPVLDLCTPDQAAGPVGVTELLAILKSQSSAVRSARSARAGGSSAVLSQRAALRGSLDYMEAAYLKLMEQRVRSNRQTAMAGGTGSVAALIQGFITASSRSPGGAMLVPPTRQSVAWQQVRLPEASGMEASADAAVLHHLLRVCQVWVRRNQERARLDAWWCVHRCTMRCAAVRWTLRLMRRARKRWGSLVATT